MTWKSVFGLRGDRGGAAAAPTAPCVVTEVPSDNLLTLDQLDEAALAFQRNDRAGWLHRTLALPDWFDHSLDADSPAFRDQMIRLWEAITGRRDYDPVQHEDAPDIAAIDAIRRPAFYGTGDSYFAGGQLMAMGHILMRSGIRPGDRILEYGAGFAQTALAFARLGAKVDTVDVNPAFCRAVGSIGEHYGADLTAHLGQFGDNPAGSLHAYDLIFFYESFHHCLDFDAMLTRLPDLLKRDGHVILAGEPIFDGPCPAMPYPWGIRLEWENVAVMRIRGWMELGFQRTYFERKFAEAGFEQSYYPDANSHWAQVYKFRKLRHAPDKGNEQMRPGVIWAYRLFLNREPTGQEIETLSRASGAPKLRNILTSSAQFATIADRAGRIFQPNGPIDFREGIIWGHRLLLNREPQAGEIEAMLRTDDSIAALRLRFTQSAEFEAAAGDAAPLIGFAIANAAASTG